MHSRRRWLHGGSGELGVFGATRYFAGRADSGRVANEPAKRLTQAKKVAESYGGLDDEKLESQELEELAKPAGNKQSKVAFFFFVGFRKKLPPPTAKSTVIAGLESEMKVVSLSASTTSSRESTIDLPFTSTASVQLEDPGGYHRFDLGVTTGDRRLQGVKVVRGSGGGDDDEERWVVRCIAPRWEEEQHEHAETFDAASLRGHRDQEDGGEGCTCTDYPARNWDSDSSSDLFDLDIDCCADI